MKRKNIIYILLSLAAVSCTRALTETESVQAPDSPVVVNTPEDAIAGELIVKFAPGMTESLDGVAAATKSRASVMTRSGRSSVDAVFEQIGVRSIERVFPVNGSEDLTRQEGLHLWYVVKFDESTDVRTAAESLARLGGDISKIQYSVRIERKPAHPSVPYSQVWNDAVRKTASRTVAAAPSASVAFDDEKLADQWHYLGPEDDDFSVPVEGGANVRKAWERCTGDREIIVAVVDEAVMFSHPDLNANMWVNEGETYKSAEDNDGNGYRGDYYGYNFAEDSPAIVWEGDGNTGHGTHVAGTVAAVNNNGIGVTGIAGGSGNNDGVRIMSIQLFSGNYGCTAYNEARGIKYAADNGAVILQCSWGNVSPLGDPATVGRGYATDEEWTDANPLEREALEYFLHHAGSPNGVIEGGLVIFAAGNEYAAAACYPGAYSEFICVAANALDGTPASYTNYATGVDISAPGGDQDYDYDYGTGSVAQGNDRVKGSVLSTMPPVWNGGEYYGYMDGTSMACPHVSGVAALGLSYAAQLHKHFTADQFKALLLESVRPFSGNMLSGYKLYHKYALQTGLSIPVRMDLSTDYAGNMGSGIIDAVKLLDLVEGKENGVALSVPNIYLRPGEKKTQAVHRFFDNGENLSYTVSVENQDIAEVSVSGSEVTVKGLAKGSTRYTVTPSSGEPQTAYITVRQTASDNGWL